MISARAGNRSVWEVKKLSDVLVLHYGKALTKEDRHDGPIPVFGSSGIVGSHDASLAEGPGVIVGRKGNVGSVFWSETDFFVIDTAYYVSSTLPLRFLFYLLPTLNFINSDSAVPGLSRSQAYSLEVLIPPLHIQQRITDILSAYDELIENCQRRIKILESMARALYREWFVHFRFPGHESVPCVPSPLGEIPQGWEVKRLDQLAEIKGGKQLEKEDIHEVGEFPVFGGNGIQGYSEKATHRGFVIAFGRVGAYCGSIHWSYGGAWLNNNSSSVAPLKHDELVLHHLLDFHFDNLRGGAAQPFISNSALASIELVSPGEAIADRFCSIIRSLRLQQATVNSQIQNLRRTRDLILPRLLSGQINVGALAA